MKELLTNIVQRIVDAPEQVKVNVISSDNVIIYEIDVLKSDVGKVIGRKGRTVQAIRTIMSSVAARNGTRCVIEVVD